MKPHELPDDIRTWLETVPKLTENDLEELRRAGEALNNDPAFCAECADDLKDLRRHEAAEPPRLNS